MSVGSSVRAPFSTKNLDGSSNPLVGSDGKLLAAAFPTALAAKSVQVTPVAVTATSDGATTGVIPDGTSHATVTSSSSSNIVTLPAPTPGAQLRVYVGANGCKVQSSAPATIGINGGTGSTAKSTIAASRLILFTCVSATDWRAFGIASDGTLATLTAAA